jgi:hypothetical protein
MPSIAPSVFTTAVDLDSTTPDLPRLKLAQRGRQQQIVHDALTTDDTVSGLYIFASCLGCQAIASDWRAHGGPTTWTKSSAYPGALLLEYAEACRVCGGSVLEVRAEALSGSCVSSRGRTSR